MKSLWFGLAATLFASAAAAQSQEKVEIVITNDRPQDVTMRFEYAFRDLTWKLIEHGVEGDGGEVTYRFPANIPGCERLREWHITDGILSIHQGNILVCDKRISLCDRIHMTMDVRADACLWREQR